MAYGKSIDFLFNQMRSYQGSLASGTITFYSAGTTTLKEVYHDRLLTTQAANPYTLSADGTAELFASGLYRVVVKNANGVIVYDFDDVEFVAATEAAGDGSVLTISDALTGDTLVTLQNVFRQIVTKSGDSAYTVTITPPATFTFADGTPNYVLYQNNESAEWVKDGTKFYLVG